ncbi:MAG: helix-turn-helix domain-containing protein, partial [Dehalococcoidia bacterium]
MSDAALPSPAAHHVKASPRVPPDAAILLRQLRHQRGLSQRQFAGLLDAPVISLRRWERGRRAPTARVWARALALQQGSAPAIVPPAASGNLPRPVSSFVGRGQELAALLPLLAGERLITLIGPGGSGKTRLAIELAAARTSLLSPAQIAERLDGSFELLAGDDRTAPLRHR